MLLALLLASVVLVDRVVAVVDQRPVMLSEVRVLAAVRGLDEAAAREALIDERLMFAEAARLPQAAVSAEEEEAAVAPLRAQHAQLAVDDVRRLARRQLAIVKYVDLRFRPQVRAGDDEVRAAWDGAAASGGGPTFEEEAPALRQALLARKLDERIEEWVKELRAAAEIRYPAGAEKAPGE